MKPKATGLPPDIRRTLPQCAVDLTAYLESQENSAEAILKCHQILAMDRVVLEIGCGCGEIARAIAARNPCMGVIATDKYDFKSQDPATSHYCQVALRWREKRLAAQNAPLDNLVVLRAAVELLQFVPGQSIDSVLMVNPEPAVGKAVLEFLAAHKLEAKFKPGNRQIIVKPYSREIGVMACGGLEFDHGEDWSRGLGFLFESPYTFTQAAPVLWSVDINRLSPYSKNSTQQDVYICKDLSHPGAVIGPRSEKPGSIHI